MGSRAGRVDAKARAVLLVVLRMCLAACTSVNPIRWPLCSRGAMFAVK